MERKLVLSLICLSGFIAFGAYCGTVMMLVDPSGDMWGMDLILQNMQCLPFAECLFQNFVFSGIMLGVVNGFCNTISIVGLLRGKEYGNLFSVVSSVLLLSWLGLQWVILDINALTTLYTVLGLVQLVLSLCLRRVERGTA